jgi:hypothetical protein
MPIPRLPQNDREITYHVGWKKGTIHPKTNQVKMNDELILPAPSDGYERYIWYKAPLLPASLDVFVICALPIISILAIVTLVYFLNQF